MFKNKVFLAIIVGVMGVIFYSFFQSQNGGPKLSYFEALKKHRNELDASIVQGDESPIEDRSLFKGLKYFEADSSLVFSAIFIPETGETTYEMTDGSKGKATKVGWVSFVKDAKSYRLMLFQEGKTFFLPFQDTSNGKDTYGGGRYINIEQKNLKNDVLTIDFNYAHNPYCAYNHSFVCPVPPKENRLDFEIKAGEKNLK